jgi:hypothetical protein
MKKYMHVYKATTTQKSTDLNYKILFALYVQLQLQISRMVKKLLGHGPMVVGPVSGWPVIVVVVNCIERC